MNFDRCNDTHYSDFTTWNPYLCMEVGMTRWISEKTKADVWDRTDATYPPASERIGIEASKDDTSAWGL